MAPPVCYFPFPTFCFDIGAKSKFHPVRDASRSWLLRTCSRGLSSFVRPKRSERRSAVDRALRAALLELGPQARARAEADGGGDWEERRRGMARRCVDHPFPPPRQPGSTRAGRLRRRSGAVLCLRSTVPSARAPPSPPPPLGAGSRQHRRLRGSTSPSSSAPPRSVGSVRHALHGCSARLPFGARRSPHYPSPQPAPPPPPPPLTRAPQPVRAGRLLRRSTGAAPCAPRRCGRHTQAHALLLASVLL